MNHLKELLNFQEESSILTRKDVFLGYENELFLSHAFHLSERRSRRINLVSRLEDKYWDRMMVQWLLAANQTRTHIQPIQLHDYL